MRTANSIEEQKSGDDPKDSPKKAKRGTHPNSLKNLVAPWTPGTIANPTGKNGRDEAREIAQAVFSGNREAIYKAMTKALLKGNAYAFTQLAERGFGKLKETVEHSVDDELLKALDEGRKRAAAR